MEIIDFFDKIKEDDATVKTLIECINYDKKTNKTLNNIILPGKDVLNCFCCKKITSINSEIEETVRQTQICQTQLCGNCNNVVCKNYFRGFFFETDSGYRSKMISMCNCCITKNIEEGGRNVMWTFIDSDDYLPIDHNHNC